QLYRDMEKGYACLHLHLSGAYPAPYFWLGLMNNRFDEKNLQSRSEPNMLRGYRTAEELKRIAELVGIARRARGKLFKYVKGRTDEDALRRTFSECSFLSSSKEEED